MSKGLCVVLLVAGIAGASPFSPLHLNVPFYSDTTDQCGPATLAGVLSYWGKRVTPEQLKKEMYVAKLHGTLPMDLMLTAQAHGLTSDMVKGSLALLRAELSAGRPVLAMLDTGISLVQVHHYVIVTGIDDARGGILAHSAGKEDKFFTFKKFLRQWEKADYWAMVSHD